MNDIRSEPIESLRIISDDEFAFAQYAIKNRIPTKYQEIREKENEKMPEDAATKTEVYGAFLLSGLIYCGHCGHKLVGSYCTKTRYGIMVPLSRLQIEKRS